MARKPEIVTAVKDSGRLIVSRTMNIIGSNSTVDWTTAKTTSSSDGALLYGGTVRDAARIPWSGAQISLSRTGESRNTDSHRANGRDKSECCATIEMVSVAASVFATHVERFRVLPLSVDLCRHPVTPAELCFVALRAIHALATQTPFSCPDLREKHDVRPNTYYPAIDYNEDFAYPRPKQYYISHFVQPLMQWVSTKGFFPAVIYSPRLFGKAISSVSAAPSPNTPVPLRFAEAVYLICQILRHHYFFDELPPFVVPAVASPRGLYPWTPPSGKEHYLSALSQRYQWDMAVYPMPCHRADIHLMAKDIIGASPNPFLAAKAISEFGPWMVPGRPATYDHQTGTLMCRGSKFSFPYCVPANVEKTTAPVIPTTPGAKTGTVYDSKPYCMTVMQFGWPDDTSGLGLMRYPLSTSEFPLKNHPQYLRAIGVPATEGALYFDLNESYLPSGYPATHVGWSANDPHVPFGASLMQDGMTVGKVAPGKQPSAPVQNIIGKDHWRTERIKAISDVPKPINKAIAEINGASAFLPLPSTSILFCNFSDVLTYGPRLIVDVAAKAGFKIIVCHVKSVLGWLHCKTATDAGKLLTSQDPLSALIGEANKRKPSIDVWAGVSMFADFRKRKIAGLPTIYKWKSDGTDFPLDVLNRPKVAELTDYWISPGDPTYAFYIKTVVTDIVKNYDIAGVVLTNTWVPRGPVDVANSLPAPSPQNVDFDPSWGFSRLAPDTTAQKVYSQASGVLLKAILDPLKNLYGLSKAVCTWPLGNGVHSTVAPAIWPEGDPADWWSVVSSDELNDRTAFFGYLDVPSLANGVDYVVYSINGNWLVDSQPYWKRVLKNHNTFAPSKAILSFQMPDEWLYTPKFWSGLANMVQNSGGAGIALHTPASCLGEYGPAFTRSALATIEAMDI